LPAHTLGTQLDDDSNPTRSRSTNNLEQARREGDEGFCGPRAYLELGGEQQQQQPGPPENETKWSRVACLHAFPTCSHRERERERQGEFSGVFFLPADFNLI
jgi:hypothetical protein